MPADRWKPHIPPIPITPSGLPSAGARWLDDWKGLPKSTGYLEKMKAANPILIPRNHRIAQAIQAACQDDFAPLHRLADALEKPFEESPENSDLEAAPLPHEKVTNTFCGT